jgi:hypothetical protein
MKNADSKFPYDAADPHSLAGLFDLADDDRPTWSERDLKAILEHQLGTQLGADLGNLPELEQLPSQAQSTAHRQDTVRTFGELFEHERPPIGLLEATRKFAKSCRKEPAAEMPAEIATVLYVASIAAARVRLGVRISSLDDSALAHSVRWALNQAWITSAVRRLLERCEAQLGNAE